MKTDEPPLSRFVVLLPHRDAEKPLRAYRRRLFAAGLWGAWSFPLAAPLAVLSRPLGAAELGALARSLREASLAGGGWFRGGEPGTEPLPPEAGAFPPGLAFYGPRLVWGGAGEGEGPWPAPESPALARRFPRPLLAGALLRGFPEGFVPPEPPVLAFRAAALANLLIRPLPGGGEGDFSFQWGIGKPVWLPPVKLKKGGGSETIEVWKDVSAGRGT